MQHLRATIRLWASTGASLRRSGRPKPTLRPQPDVRRMLRYSLTPNVSSPLGTSAKPGECPYCSRRRSVQLSLPGTRLDALARATEQAVYVATEIATELAGTARERNRRRTPEGSRTANKSGR